MWPHNWENIFTREIAQYAKWIDRWKHTVINIAQLPYSCFIISFEWFLISHKFRARRHASHCYSILFDVIFFRPWTCNWFHINWFCVISSRNHISWNVHLLLFATKFWGFWEKSILFPKLRRNHRTVGFFCWVK